MMKLAFAATLLASASAGASKLVNPCLDATQPYAKQPWCAWASLHLLPRHTRSHDAARPTRPPMPLTAALLARPHLRAGNASLDIDTRAADMVSRMDLKKEKIPNLDTSGSAIPSLGLPGYNWWEEASSGVSVQAPRGTTKFAYPITTGMSFNRTLWQLTGRQIGHEARALMNAGAAGSTFWAPVINLAREPRWGRNIEVPGEDPYQVGEYAEWFVKGFEQAPEDEGHIQASACCKHYAANSMEHTTEGGQTHTRHDFSATITQQDLVDSYLKPFQSCVEKAHVSGLMCSYNAIVRSYTLSRACISTSSLRPFFLKVTHACCAVLCRVCHDRTASPPAPARGFSTRSHAATGASMAT